MIFAIWAHISASTIGTDAPSSLDMKPHAGQCFLTQTDTPKQFIEESCERMDKLSAYRKISTTEKTRNLKQLFESDRMLQAQLYFFIKQRVQKFCIHPTPELINPKDYYIYGFRKIIT